MGLRVRVFGRDADRGGGTLVGWTYHRGEGLHPERAYTLRSEQIESKWGRREGKKGVEQYKLGEAKSTYSWMGMHILFFFFFYVYIQPFGL